MSVMKDKDAKWSQRGFLIHFRITPLCCCNNIACDNSFGSRERRELEDAVGRVATRGWDSADRSPLCPVVRCARGVTTPIYKEGLLFGWDRGLERERERERQLRRRRAQRCGGIISGVSCLNRRQGGVRRREKSEREAQKWCVSGGKRLTPSFTPFNLPHIQCRPEKDGHAPQKYAWSGLRY